MPSFPILQDTNRIFRALFEGNFGAIAARYFKVLKWLLQHPFIVPVNIGFIYFIVFFFQNDIRRKQAPE
jgi:multidrug efflux pump subunit AcrB